MKTLLKVFAIAMLAAIAVSAFASCGGGETQQVATDAAVTSATDGEDIGDVDYSQVGYTLENYSQMEHFLQNWDDGRYDNKVIKVTGTNATRLSNCSILIADKKGSQSRGFSWEVIDGKYPDDYPADDAEITLVGVLKKTDEFGTRVLMVPKENIETK